jgi:two-component system response regulator MprA
MEAKAQVRILLVEDDARMRTLVRRGLVEDGHNVEVAETGPIAIDMAGEGFDAVVLDVMLPGCSGFDVVQRLRASGNRTPVLLLTARDANADIVAGLDAGADDYLAKPFSFKVLLARLRALGRRAEPAHGPRLEAADVALDTAAHVVTRAGATVPLTRTEYNLLECLMRNAGRVVTRQILIERLWGNEREIESNTLDAFVKSLRQKLDAGDRPRLIHTVRGIGYSFRQEIEP